MRTMLSMRWLAFIALAALLGCGVDGGVGGTGISTISGNVALGAAAQVENPADLEGIGVGIAGTDLHTETDAAGYFELEGEMPSAVTVEFTETNGTVSTLDIGRIPFGGVVSLKNVRFNRNLASAESIELDFREANIVAAAICSGSLGTVDVVDPRSEIPFTINVNGSTSYSTNPTAGHCPDQPGCSDLVPQRTIRIRGLQASSSIQAQQIVFQRCRR